MDPSRIPGDIDTPLHRLDQRFGYGKADPVPAPVCALSGQAAGTAAALSVKDNLAVSELDINKLQKQLINDKFILNF